MLKTMCVCVLTELKIIPFEYLKLSLIHIN